MRASFEPEAVAEFPMPTGTVFRNQRHEQRAAGLTLSHRNGEENWGRILFHFERVSGADSARMVHYGMTKTAQIAVARGIAESVAGTGVTVNSVLAGPTNRVWVALSRRWRKPRISRSK
jgi:NAD(P)-dependent dehydrogenase (short-subunit alcohol dehydrogenase family)